MASIDAKLVAEDVKKRILDGSKITMSEIMENRGYAEATLKNPKNVTETESYKSVMQPFAERLKREIERIQTAMEGKDLDKEQYKTLTESLDKLNRNYLL